jgi:hypothetical protein
MQKILWNCGRSIGPVKSLQAHRGEDAAEDALDGNLSAWEEKMSSNRSEPELDLNLGPGSRFSKLCEPDPAAYEWSVTAVNKTA